ncbi:MAG: T9SS type A sorting domain-containing protein, partial [Bacteroidota bacterium]
VFLPAADDAVDFTLPLPDENNCDAKQGNAFILSGGVNVAGELTPATTVTLPLGKTDVRYYNCTNAQGKSLDEPFPLPDGTGVNYSIPIEVTGYPNDGTVANAGSPIVICATMEHSYLGDLDIWVTCPTGQRMDLHIFRQGNGVSDQLLGLGDENTITPDSAFQYCWRIGAARTITEAVNQSNIGENQPLPAGNYAPEDGLNGIANCPVNGVWNLNFRDNLAVDNGSVAAWSVEFSDELNGRCDYSVDVRKTVSTSAPPVLPGLELTVAPNPFTDQLSLRLTATQAQRAELRIFSATGQTIYRQELSLLPGARTLPLATENWLAGAYYLHLRTEAGETFRKLIRQ